MLHTVSVRDFQSLKKVDLEIGGFTVISGPSNSGKSAFMRAIRAVVENLDSPAVVVRHGAKRAAAGLTFEDGQAAVVRGKAKSEYILNAEKYPKAGKTVPDEVAAFLRFAEIEGDHLSFAFQFDRPYLLADPATQVAKVFGDLTNVTVLFAAVREANRRRLETTSRLKERRRVLEDLHLRKEEYVGVADRARSIKATREKFDRVVVSGRELARFRAQLSVVTHAAAVIEQLTDLPSLPESRGEALSARYDSELGRLRGLVELCWRTETNARTATEVIAAMSSEIDELDARYHRTLVESGTCPLCGQAVNEEVQV